MEGSLGEDLMGEISVEDSMGDFTMEELGTLEEKEVKVKMEKVLSVSYSSLYLTQSPDRLNDETDSLRLCFL